MIKRIELLRRNLDTFEGKFEFVTYMCSVVLLILHFLFLSFYVYAKLPIMIVISALGFLVINYYVHWGIKDRELFGIVCYSTITVHTIAAIVCVGWRPGYYLWLYGLTCAFFLPSFGKMKGMPTPRPIFLGLVYVVIYYSLGFLVPSGIIQPLYQISELATIVLFGINSTIVFFTVFIFTYFFTTRQRFREDSLKQLADFDNLTKLRNRNAINRIIDERISEGEEFSLAILDIDLFKHVNDTYGHNAGDHVLRELANKIRKLEGFGITGGRWGGEEFILLGPKDMSFNQFTDIMQDLRRNVRESKFNYERSIIKITVSIGVSSYKKRHQIKKVIDQADKRLYKAKLSGRNKVIFK